MKPATWRTIGSWLALGAAAGLLALRAGAAVLADREEAERPKLLVDPGTIFSDRKVRLGATNSVADQFVSQARALFEADDQQGALDVLAKANAADPRNIDALLARAWIYINLNRYSEALDLALKARLLAPSDPTPDLLAGFCYHALGMITESLESYGRALRTPTPHTAEIHQNIGLLYVIQGDITNGIRHYAAAVSLKPKDGDAHEKYGSALFLGRRYVDAAEEHKQAIELNPAAIESYNSLGAAELMAGQVQNSIPNFREAINRRERFAKAYSNLGAALELANLLEDSLRALVTALEYEPGRADAWNNLLKTMVRLYGVATFTPGQPVPLTAQDPEMARRHLAAARELRQQPGQNKLAVAHMLRALFFDKANPLYYQELGDFFEKAGNAKLAGVIQRKAELVAAPAPGPTQRPTP